MRRTYCFKWDRRRGKLYREYVESTFSNLGRFLEFAFLRPLMLGVFIKAVEMLLESFSLGFSAWRTLVQDFEVASPERPYYPTNLLVQQRLDIHPKAAPLAVPVSADLRQHDDRTHSDAALPRGLHLSVGEITNEVMRQVRLRHSAYYDNEEVIVRVADFVTGGEVRETETTPSLSISPSSEFWDALLTANVGLGVLSVLIRGGVHPEFIPMMVFTFAVATAWVYVVPFALLWVGLVFYGAKWRRSQAKIWRRFWLLWAICAIAALIFSATVLRAHEWA